jgi:creatinine amidohydrolase/Fe(II)-dependent formamide hydrolase-like protein
MAEFAGQSDRQVHPIFINESGRHWFTALNAYRHFQDQVPHTARDWVNSDRLFNWMLRHMPFVRKDFANVRSDEYPIRLWTVAVFLFGALPLLRKRHLGCLLLGDEYDTTVRRRHEGIPHYDGLYDQSIHFDNALSRYFLQKGWTVRQFSILRPLSELLIETILSRRYPELLRLQTSCHAAHQTPEGIKPCGRCEKCRRIVSMLLAADADPCDCGYTREQIDACLSSLAAKGIHQEEAGARHLLHMLIEKRIIDAREVTRFAPSLQPEVLQLRFDSERSPVNAIPRNLRPVLWRIFLQYADGAVRRKGKKWEPFDVLHDRTQFEPYLFEMAQAPNRTKGHSGRPGQSPYLWGELNWPDAQALFETVDIVALLPVGAVEQHGPHLPLDTDAFDADYLARRVAETCSDPRPLVLPLVPYGVSYHHDDFKGTISIRNETLSQLIYDIGMAAARNGIRKLVIINGHGGNDPALNFAAQMINRDARIFVCVDTGETSDVDIAAIVRTANDVHAGEIETSTALAVRPELVQMERAFSAVPRFSSDYLDFSSKRGINWYAHTRHISTTGVMGDPSKASSEKGEQIWMAMIAHLVSFVEDLKQLSLEKIHQRRL